MLKQPVRTDLSDFIKKNMGSQFVIPVYQRNYTWNPEKETARFMDDIEDLLEKRTSTHFLGIVIYMESEISALFRQLMIVDGQQRLTTAFIFLLVLKKLAEEKKDRSTAGMIEDYYLFNRHSASAARERLKASVSDDDVYERLLYDGSRNLNGSEKESLVYRNYDYIEKRIRRFLTRHTPAEVLDTLNGIDLLEFPLSETDNAQQIFESINSTGAPLTSADLIRNYILMNHTDEVQERLYKLYWQPLEAYNPESRKLEEFFRYYLAVKTYQMLSRKDVYEEFKICWSEDSRKTEEKMQEILRYARYYHDIYEGKAEDPLVEESLVSFRRNGSRMPAPFLMDMYRLYDEKTISARELAAIIQLIDSYITRRALCGMESGSLSRYFPSLLRTVMSAMRGKGKKDIVSIVKTHLVNYNRGRTLSMPTDQQIRSSMREINAYGLMCIRPVLDAIEHYGSHAKVDLSELNIEHIMPQHPNGWWKKNAGMKDEEEYSEYANLIGNLTLCAEYDNTRMGNEDFAYKKKILSNTSHIRLNEEILKKKQWKKEDILKRCDEMAEKIIRLYPYSISRTTETRSSEDIVVLSSPTASARALLHGENDVEILPGTALKAYGSRDIRRYSTLYRDLFERGILSEHQDGRALFDQSWHFSSLNEAAQFLMHRGGENTSAWHYEDGRSILEPVEAKTEEVEQPEQEKTEVRKQKKTKPASKQNRNQKKAKESSGTAKAEQKKSSKNKKNVKQTVQKKKQNSKQNAKANNKPVQKKAQVKKGGGRNASGRRKPAHSDMKPQKTVKNTPVNIVRFAGQK